MSRIPKQIRNGLIGLILLVGLLFPSNVFSAVQYCFDEPTVDKIIVTGEKYVITEKALNQCNLQVSTMEDMIKVQDITLKRFDDTIKKAMTLIEEQKKTIEGVNELVEKARADERSKAFWSKITWTSVGVAVGTLVGIIVMSF